MSWRLKASDSINSWQELHLGAYRIMPHLLCISTISCSFVSDALRNIKPVLLCRMLTVFQVCAAARPEIIHHFKVHKEKNTWK
ncbi:hypothetical protein GOODEAATRI_022435, partial [Goodea atripinnis]